MEKRKSAPIWGLFYREIYPMLKELTITYLIGIGLAVVFYLIKLSMEIGNLADMSGEKLEMLKMMLPGYATYFPGVMFMAVSLGSISSFQFEMTPKFRCFTASIPVSEWKFIGVKFLSSAFLLLVGLLAACLNAAAMCGVFDAAFDKAIIANLLLCAAVMSLCCVVVYIFNYLFRNPMTAVIVSLVIVYAAAIVYIIMHTDLIEQLSSENVTEAMSMIFDKITGFSSAFLPFSVPCMVGVLGLGWVLCSLLAKRREK